MINAIVFFEIVIQLCCERNETLNMNKFFGILSTIHRYKYPRRKEFWRRKRMPFSYPAYVFHPEISFDVILYKVAWGKIDLGFSSCWNSKTRFNQKTLDNGTPSFSLSVLCSTFVKVLLRVSPCTPFSSAGNLRENSRYEIRFSLARFILFYD